MLGYYHPISFHKHRVRLPYSTISLVAQTNNILLYCMLFTTIFGLQADKSSCKWRQGKGAFPIYVQSFEKGFFTELLAPPLCYFQKKQGSVSPQIRILHYPTHDSHSHTWKRGCKKKYVFAVKFIFGGLIHNLLTTELYSFNIQLFVRM